MLTLLGSLLGFLSSTFPEFPLGQVVKVDVQGNDLQWIAQGLGLVLAQHRQRGRT